MLIEDILDEIARSNRTLPLPGWQKKELDKRLRLYAQGEMETKDWNQVHAELREKYRINRKE